MDRGWPRTLGLRTSIVRVFPAITPAGICVRNNALAACDQLAADIDVVEDGQSHTGRVAERRCIGPLIEDDLDALDPRDTEYEGRTRGVGRINKSDSGGKADTRPLGGILRRR